jgi:predicted RNA-binding protein associated with RNAse of E/G family
MPYTFIEGFDDDGRLIELYLDICAPPRIVGDELHYVDHELDVVREMPAPAYLMDEDEFAEAAQAYGYTPEFQVWCHDAARQAMDFANAVEPSIFRAS